MSQENWHQGALDPGKSWWLLSLRQDPGVHSAGCPPTPLPSLQEPRPPRGQGTLCLASVSPELPVAGMSWWTAAGACQAEHTKPGVELGTLRFQLTQHDAQSGCVRAALLSPKGLGVSSRLLTHGFGGEDGDLALGRVGWGCRGFRGHGGFPARLAR